MATAVRTRRATGLLLPGADRVSGYLVVNLWAIWSSVIALLLLDRVVGPSSVLRWDAATLAGGGLAYGLALALARQDRLRTSAGVALAGTWTIALALTWFTPILVPVGLLIIHVPSLILIDVFRLRTRTAILATTVVLTGLLVVTGESRRPAWDRHHPDIPSPEVLVGVFTLLVAGVLVVGLRDYVLRLARHTRELRLSRSRVADAALEARRGIEQDLHDGAQQRLTTLAVDLGRATRLVEQDPERAHRLLAELQVHLQDAIRELRHLAHGIYPPLLEQAGLPGALPAAARRTVLPCVVEVELAHRHSKTVEAAVYFCCLEAMQNADRHSGGDLITLRVRDDDDGEGEACLRFSIVDTGDGFDHDAVEHRHGLTGMRDRIQAVGGELWVQSEPRRGTTVAGRFPPGTARTR